MKTLAVLATAVALTALPGPAQAAQPATAGPARIVNAAATPVTATRVVVSVATSSVRNGSAVRVIDDGRVIGRARVTAGKAIVPISSRIKGQRVTVQVAGKRRVLSVRTGAAGLAASPWVVVNKKAQAVTATPHLVPVGAGRLTAPAAAAYQRMATDASRDGRSMWVASSYRSVKRQETLYDAYVARDGRKAADTFSARPGYSEHQTGLALDVAGERCTLSGCFAATPTGRWVARNAAGYGFIIRYPAGGADSTGYRYEPWHLRYVGRWLAEYLVAAGSPTLEQAFALGAAPDYGRSH